MIFYCTYGVVFLGTPHRGSPQASLGILAANACRAMLRDANTSILRSLEQDSEVLDRIREAFERMMTREKVMAYSFVEELPVAGVGMVGTFYINSFTRMENSWQEQIVERYSGQIGNASEGKGYIHASHQEMSKFSSCLETGYKRVVDVVEDFVGEAGKAMESKRLPRSISTTG